MTSKPQDLSEARWWRLYRKEREKFATPGQMPKDSEIVRAAREATRKINMAGTP